MGARNRATVVQKKTVAYIEGPGSQVASVVAHMCSDLVCEDVIQQGPLQCLRRMHAMTTLEARPGISITRSAVIRIRVRGAAIVRVPAVNALALADAGHQLATAHRGSGLADGIASGRGASARAAIRRKAGTWCCQRKHRCKCDCRAQGPQIFHCYSHPLWFDAMPASRRRPCDSGSRVGLPKPPITSSGDQCETADH